VNDTPATPLTSVEPEPSVFIVVSNTTHVFVATDTDDASSTTVPLLTRAPTIHVLVLLRIPTYKLEAEEGASPVVDVVNPAVINVFVHVVVTCMRTVHTNVPPPKPTYAAGAVPAKYAPAVLPTVVHVMPITPMAFVVSAVVMAVMSIIPSLLLVDKACELVISSIQ
jgi:hypothetical protein